jgi:hypothetical protein
LASAGQPEWKEWKTESSDCYYFEEMKREGEIIWLRDASRNLLIQLPVEGGASTISSDGGLNWQRLYDVRKE